MYSLTFVDQLPKEPPTALLHPRPVNHEAIAMTHIKSKQYLIEQYVLISYTSAGLPYPSIRYTFDSFIDSLDTMAVQGFGADFRFLLYEGNPFRYQAGLVNLAAFLANAMVETIQSDSCDELNWQQVAGRHAIANSCGQEGRSYQDEGCQENENDYSCDVDPTMEITAVTSGNQVRAPPPFKCEPGNENAGYWDSSSGTAVNDVPYSNTAGRTDVEGCCWWGRGVSVMLFSEWEQCMSSVSLFNTHVGIASYSFNIGTANTGDL